VVTCDVCGGGFDDDSAAVCWGPTDDGGTFFYEPFLEALRTSWPERFYHPLCYANEHGVETILGLIHAHELMNRGLAWKMRGLEDEIAALKRREIKSLD
jgi:hypothetical protein